MQPPLCRIFGFKALTATSRSVLAGVYDPLSDIDDHVKTRVADRVQFCARSGPPVQQPPPDRDRTGGPVEEASKQARALIQHILLLPTTYLHVPRRT
jgi:hypothetical protein